MKPPLTIFLYSSFQKQHLGVPFSSLAYRQAIVIARPSRRIRTPKPDKRQVVASIAFALKISLAHALLSDCIFNFATDRLLFCFSFEEFATTSRR
jgi:hypothetical protein